MQTFGIALTCTVSIFTQWIINRCVRLTPAVVKIQKDAIFSVLTYIACLYDFLN